MGFAPRSGSGRVVPSAISCSVRTSRHVPTICDAVAIAAWSAGFGCAAVRAEDMTATATSPIDNADALIIFAPPIWGWNDQIAKGRAIETWRTIEGGHPLQSRET